MNAYKKIQKKIDRLQIDLNSVKMNGMGGGNLMRTSLEIRASLQELFEQDEITASEFTELLDKYNYVVGI